VPPEAAPDEPRAVRLCGVRVHATDYRTVVDEVLRAARAGRSFTVTPIASHGLMLAYDDPELRYRLNRLDRVVPDGQPVRRALDRVHGTGLTDRVAGPVLMGRLVQAAAAASLSVFLFGSTAATLERLSERLRERHPGLRIAGVRPSAFRRLEPDEEEALAAEIRDSGADMVFVGLGCPRQETWLYEWRERLSLPLLAFGAAFDFHAGVLRRPPEWVGDWGLEWAYRWVQEPRRLWHRYLVLGGRFAGLMLADRASAEARRKREARLAAGERRPAERQRLG